MFANETRVLLILPQDVVDRARELAGRATTALKLPVSLQIVLRALIEEGLRREDRAVLANVEAQAHTVRQIRRNSAGRTGRTGRTAAADGGRQPAGRRRLAGRERDGRRK